MMNQVKRTSEVIDNQLDECGEKVTHSVCKMSEFVMRTFKKGEMNMQKHLQVSEVYQRITGKRLEDWFEVLEQF